MSYHDDHDDHISLITGITYTRVGALIAAALLAVAGLIIVVTNGPKVGALALYNAGLTCLIFAVVLVVAARRDHRAIAVMVYRTAEHLADAERTMGRRLDQLERAQQQQNIALGAMVKAADDLATGPRRVNARY